MILFLLLLSSCKIVEGLPDKVCTPGEVSIIDSKVLCAPVYTTKSARHTSQKTKNQVFAEYGVVSHNRDSYEVDHLISLELGGADTIKNLWPQSANPKPGFHEKDKVENWLHRQVCSGTMKLNDAQEGIRTNWLQYWDKVK